VELTELIVPGEEEQSDESLLKTGRECSVIHKGIKQYKQWERKANGAQRAMSMNLEWS
jgi:hypothetical protein